MVFKGTIMKQRRATADLPRKQQVLTSSEILPAMEPGAPPFVSYVVATSQTKLDPLKGPEDSLWDLNAVYGVATESGTATELSCKSLVKGLPYEVMCVRMLAVEFNAAGRPVDLANLTPEDARFAEERRQQVSPKNILHRISFDI
jgi:hypothetical protein